MEIDVQNDPLEAMGYDPVLTVAEVMNLLDVSDGTARKFLKAHNLYLKVSGAVRVPRLGLARVLFEREETPDDTETDVLDFPEAEAS